MPSPEPIRDAAGVAAVDAEARAAGRAAIDLENSSGSAPTRPSPCLAQVATPEGVHLIDPIEGAPLDDVAALVSDPGVEAVMHAPSADLTLLGMAFGTRPQRIRDLQIVAGFVGLGAGQGLATLLERVLGVRLDKGERYTDWSRRPLSPAQLEYAAGDVVHLLELADELDRRARALGREEWVAEEHERRYGPDARIVPDPELSWRRVKGARPPGRPGPRRAGLGGRVARARGPEPRPPGGLGGPRPHARRDRPAAARDPEGPRGRAGAAGPHPGGRRRLPARGGPGGRGRSADVDALGPAPRGAAPPGRPGPPRAVLVTARAEAVNLAPSLVATRDEISSFLLAAIAGDLDGQPLATGWRRELVGDALIELAEGRLALAADSRRPYLTELSRPPGGAAPVGSRRVAASLDHIACFIDESDAASRALAHAADLHALSPEAG